MAEAFGPMDKTAKWKGWFAKVDDDLFGVGTSDSRIDGERVVVCNVFVTKIDQAKLVQALKREMNLELVYDEKELFNRDRVWRTKVGDVPIFVHLRTLQYSHETMASATLSAVVKYKR